MKILASDLDGTLIINNQISKKDLTSLKTLREKGNKIIVSTGRTLSGARDILDKFTFEYDYLLLCNGGLILDEDNNILHNKVISNEVKNGLINDFGDDENVLMYYDDLKNTYLIKKEKYNKDEELRNFIENFSNKISIHDALKVEGTYQMLSIFTTNGSVEHAEEVKEKVLSKYGDEVDAFRNDCFVDIVPKGCSKGNGIKYILDNYEKLSTDNVYTVGDSLNDIPMFKITKNSYTFNRAEEIVKPHANNIVDNVHEVVEDMISV